jgi:hypothetical protein
MLGLCDAKGGPIRLWAWSCRESAKIGRWGLLGGTGKGIRPNYPSENIKKIFLRLNEASLRPVPHAA